ncbi:MAG: creatininase family protein [Wenzhouxiangellaceae bacterium]|nr:MAG: creatininase family protein [Wenzhouxiangellaceae bacterium]
MISYWQDLTSTELVEQVHESLVAVMVLGAIEQHGPHLPLSTDLDIGRGLLVAALARLADDVDVIVLPSLAISASDEHLSFPGSLSIGAETAACQVIAAAESLERVGINRLVLLNSHGGNIGWMEQAALDIRRRLGLLVVKANYMQMPPPAEVLSARELASGLHGGQAETAMMLHLHPDRVRCDRLGDFPSSADPDTLLGPTGPASYAWLAEDLNGDGVTGNAAAATAEQGKLLVDHYATLLARVLTEAAAFDKNWSKR